MKKGISMAGLTMYILVLTLVIGIIVAYNANVLSDTDKFVKNTKMYEQYSKFNMFFLQILGENPTIEVISENVIVVYTSQGSSMLDFDSENHIVRYVTTGKMINICEFVEELEFRQVLNTLRVNMKFQMDDITYMPEGINYAVGGWIE